MSEFDRTLELLRSLNRQLDEYERTQDRSLLVTLQTDIRKAKPQLERVVQNPEYKTSVDSDRFFEFKDEMKRLIERSKKYGVLGNQKIDARPSQPEKRNSLNSFRGVFSKDNSSSEENGSSSRPKNSNISFAPGTIDLIDNPVDVRAKPPPLKGWLRKQGEDLFKVNKRRWFEQRLWKIEYFKSDQKRSASDALGHIEFASMQKIEILKEPKFGFHLCTEFRMFVLQAETQQEFEEIVRGIVEWKSYYDNENKSSEKEWGDSSKSKPAPRETEKKIQLDPEDQPDNLGSRYSSGFGRVAEEARISSSREETNNDLELERPVSPRKSPTTFSKEEPSMGSRSASPSSPRGGEAGGDEVALRAEIASLKERLAKEEKRGNEARALLAEKEKQLISTKAMLDASTESNECDRTLKNNLESDFTQLQTRYEVEKRTWKEERHKREEEAADSRREMASLMAAQRTTEDENNRLKEELRAMEGKVSEMKKGNKGGSATSRLSVRMQNDHADELKKVKTELIILQQHEKEERITRRQVEEERDVLQEKLEIETKKRERAEERRKSDEGELVKANSDVETLKRKNAELEGFITRLERNLEEKTKKETGFQQQIKELQMQNQLAGKLVEKAKEELEDPELYKQVTDLAEEGGFSSEQVGKVVQFIGQYLEKYSDVEEQLFASQDHTSELEEALDGAEQQLEELRGEYDKLLKEYAAKDQYVNTLKARGGAEKQAGAGRDKLAMQLENMQERCLASQSQVALLSHQLSMNQGEAKATISAKEKAIAGLRKDLGELRKQYQELRQSILLRSGASEVELEELSDIKQELFVNLAVFTKMNLAASGVHCNEHVLDLYEEAKDLDYREWKAWIHDRYQGGSGKLQRDYARHSASTPSYSSSAPRSSSSSPASSASSPGLASTSTKSSPTTKTTTKTTTKSSTTKTTKSSSPSRTSQPGEAKKVKKVVKKKKPNVVEL